MKFDQITENHLLQVAEQFSPQTIPGYERPNIYVAEINGQEFPVKPLLRQAYRNAYNAEPPRFNSAEARTYLAKLGYHAKPKKGISDKINELIGRYISLVKKDGNAPELYKWQLLEQYHGRPDLSTEDLYTELKSIDYNKLVYFEARKAMDTFATQAPDKYRLCLQLLLNDKIIITERIPKFQEKMTELAQQIIPGRRHEHDERTIATILAFYNPDVYPLFKYSFYYKLCTLLDFRTGKTNECYLHYQPLLQEIIATYIAPNNELLKLKQQFLTPDCYADPNHLVLAQDILYRVLDQGKNQEDMEYNADEIAQLLYKHFNQIWRCADSGHWKEIRDSELLTFDWLDKNVNYLEAEKDSGDGWKSIDPWVNGLSAGDLIFIMAKNNFQGICIARTEYDFNGPLLKVGGKERPAIEVDFIFKLEKPIDHDLQTHNRPRTFSKIDQFNFGLKNVLSYLIKKKPEAIQALLTYLTNISAQKEIMNQLEQMHCNTIFYGPPGTGKTYELGRLQKRLFTDNQISNSAEHREELLRRKMEDYTYWEIIAAILYTSSQPLAVKQICEHALYRARFNPANKVKPQNMAWVDLQAYATDSSTNSSAKYRRGLQIFEKNEKSEWAIPAAKREEVAGILDEELLQLAANPVVDQNTRNTPNERFFFITFHQKYNYEDFIEGIKPVLAGVSLDAESANLQFKLEKGIFYRACLDALRLAGFSSFKECKSVSFEERSNKFKEAAAVADKHFALLIDEINRANISAVFGELITLIEDGKRIGQPNELWVKLPYSNDDFCVPPNLFIIGTMNTADKSIALLDVALRRRFHFKPMYPIYELAVGENAWWGDLLMKLNQGIYEAKNNNPDFFIGHSFFLNKQEEQKKEIFNTSIIPLLMEYFQNSIAKVEKVLTAAQIPVQKGGIEQNYQLVAL